MALSASRIMRYRFCSGHANAAAHRFGGLLRNVGALARLPKSDGTHTVSGKISYIGQIMAGIYYHIPFCRRICAYCDFYKSAELGRTDELVAALHRELEERRDYLGGEAVGTRYFGGGTPSLLPAETIRGLLEHAAALFDCTQVEETTLEANPDDLTEEYLSSLREAGIDRLSVGVQSFDDDCLRRMNRRHTAEQAARALRNARKAGFGNIAADLIFGMPGCGSDVLQRSLDTLLAIGVEHVSAYHLTVEPNTAFGRMAARGRFTPVDEATGEREFLRVHETLTAAGFEHYEVSNYALPGFRARHNAAYWQGVKYLGLGPAAHSFDGEERHWNVPSVARYIAGEPAAGERLTRHDRFNEYLLTRLRTAEGIDLAEIEARFGAARREKALRDAAPMLRAGTLRAEGGRLAIPARRFLVSDAVIEALFETVPETQAGENEKC